MGLMGAGLGLGGQSAGAAGAGAGTGAGAGGAAGAARGGVGAGSAHAHAPAVTTGPFSLSPSALPVLRRFAVVCSVLLQLPPDKKVRFAACPPPWCRILTRSVRCACGCCCCTQLGLKWTARHRAVLPDLQQWLALQSGDGLSAFRALATQAQAQAQAHAQQTGAQAGKGGDDAELAGWLRRLLALMPLA